MRILLAAVLAVRVGLSFADAVPAGGWKEADMKRPKPSRVIPSDVRGGAPSDAVVLFDGSRESFEKNWCDAAGRPPKWHYSEDGYFYATADRKNGGNLFTRAKFGDCQLHLEFRHDPQAIFSDKGPQMRGNSGVFLMSNYEIQVLESYFTSRELEGKPEFVDNYTDGQAGAVYIENPPLVNPARKPGEWQSYDIVFHRPLWEGEKLVRPGSITLFFNGVLVQDHWEMRGLSMRKPPRTAAEPLYLQDHGCVVQYRNVWYRPLAPCTPAESKAENAR